MECNNEDEMMNRSRQLAEALAECLIDIENLSESKKDEFVNDLFRFVQNRTSS